MGHMIGPLLTNASPYFVRSQRVIGAADAALRRVDPHNGEDLFAPLGELLVWLIALDDLLAAADGTYRAQCDADSDGIVLPGIRYARNAAVHGELVVSATYATSGAALGAPSRLVHARSGPIYAMDRAVVHESHAEAVQASPCAGTVL